MPIIDRKKLAIIVLLFMSAAFLAFIEYTYRSGYVPRFGGDRIFYLGQVFMRVPDRSVLYEVLVKKIPNFMREYEESDLYIQNPRTWIVKMNRKSCVPGVEVRDCPSPNIAIGHTFSDQEYQLFQGWLDCKKQNEEKIFNSCGVQFNIDAYSGAIVEK